MVHVDHVDLVLNWWILVYFGHLFYVDHPNSLDNLDHIDIFFGYFHLDHIDHLCHLYHINPLDHLENCESSLVILRLAGY